MKPSRKKIIRLGDLISMACDRASLESSDPQVASRRAAAATVKALLYTGNVRALLRLGDAEDALS